MMTRSIVAVCDTAGCSVSRVCRASGDEVAAVAEITASGWTAIIGARRAHFCPACSERLRVEVGRPEPSICRCGRPKTHCSSCPDGEG